MKKRIVAMFLAVCFIVTLLPTAAFAAAGDVVATGNCEASGNESPITWTVTDNGDATYTITFSGKGRMASYANASAVPWNSYVANITKAVVGEGITYLSSRAFVSSKQLASVELPESLTSIGEVCFYQSGLASIQFPSALKVINNGAFWGAKLTGDIHIPETVTYIGTNAFNSCPITSVNLPAGLEGLGASAFRNTKLKEMPELPKAITELNYTFNGCSDITSITIPAQVTDILGAFGGTGITSVTIPSNVTSYRAAFNGCKSLESVVIESLSDNIDGDNNNASWGAFQNCTNLKHVELPDWVTTIGRAAFAGCTSLEDTEFLRNVKTIGMEAFQKAGLKGTLVLNATDIKDRAFDKCYNLGPNIVLNEQATIGENAFRDDANLNGVKYVQQGQGSLNKMPNAKTIAYLNGGTFDADTEFEAGTLAEPEKPGARFVGWYTMDGTNGEWGEEVTTPVAGSTYYAKWVEHASTITTDIGEKTFTVGRTEPTEFTFTTTANDDAGTKVVGTSNFSDPDAIETLEYYEPKDGKWYPFSGASFGPADGFPMSDATSTFRAAFNKAGIYTFTASMKNAATGEVLCSTEVTFKVSAAKHSITIVDEEGAKIAELPDAEEDSTVTLPNIYDGIPEGKVVSSWEAVDPEDLEISNNSFVMPKQDVKLRATLAEKTTDDEPEQTVSGGSTAGTDAAVILGGVAISAATYFVGTQIWMETHLPNGTIPTSREQLALMLWNAAGKPQPAETALYADISAEAADTQLAARWCVEQGLMKDYGENFQPGKYTFRPQVIKAWNQLQKMN